VQDPDPQERMDRVKINLYLELLERHKFYKAAQLHLTTLRCK
jgi:hypothetical protein